MGSIYSARVLTAADYGVYAILTYLSIFLVTFGDAGFAASLIRSRTQPTDREYSAIFTMQFILVLLILLIFIGFSSVITHEGLNNYLLGAIFLSFFITSFSTIPIVKMERKLQFKRIAIIDLLQAITFNVTLITFLYYDFNVISIAIAFIFRAITGFLLSYIMQPTKLNIIFDWHIVRNNISFGMSYQGVKIVSLLKDSITPVFIGLYLGMSDVGIASWATTTAAYPVLCLFIFQRLLMPTFANLQAEPEKLKKLVEISVLVANGLVAVFSITMLILIEPLILLIFGEKWSVALPIYLVLWSCNVFVPTAVVCISLLNALGHSKINLYYSLLWMIGTWVLAIPMVITFGVFGYAIATFVIQMTNLLLYKSTLNKFDFNIAVNVMPIWILVSICSLPLAFLNYLLPPDTVIQLALYVVGSMVLTVSAVIIYGYSKIKSLFEIYK